MTAVLSSGPVYVSPEIQIIQMSPEGVLCGSTGSTNEPLSSDVGVW